MKRYLILVFLLSLPAMAELPDAPMPQKTKHNHGLYGTWPTRGAFGASVTVRTIDTIQTCNNMHRGNFREDIAPARSCRGIILWNTGMVSAGIGSQWIFHRLGWHKLESIGHLVSAGGSTQGILYTHSHYKRD